MTPAGDDTKGEGGPSCADAVLSPASGLHPSPHSAPASHSPAGVLLRNVRLVVAYDGTDFAGWQVQPGHETVQGVLMAAIERMTGEQPLLHASGRTDAGVHAIGQVVNFQTRTRLPCDRLFAGLQALIPATVSILAVEDAPLKFHARYQAVRKRYRYVIDNSPHAIPFLRRYSYHSFKPLDVAAMQAGARELLGQHDFRSFESDWPNRDSSIRTIYELTIERSSAWSGWLPPGPQPVPTLGTPAPTARPKPEYNLARPLICIDVVADGFLYNMVRSIVGTLLDVGRGRWTAADVRRILQAQDRRLAGTTAPAQGLFLVEVNYPAEDSAENSAALASPEAAKGSTNEGCY